MRRREFISLLGGAAAGCPLAARGQAPASRPLIAILVGGTPATATFLSGFREGMNALGYAEGRNYDVVYRFGAGDLTRMPALAEELVGFKPSIILTANTSAAIAAKNATATIPIVSAAMIDPMDFGLVASHARPGGNFTGLLSALETLMGKQLEIGVELVPGVKKAGLLVNPNSLASTVLRRGAQAAADSLKIGFVEVEVRSSDDIDTSFEALARATVQLVLVHPDPMLLAERQRIAARAQAFKLPVVYGFREHADDGGLLSYGMDLRANWMRAATFVDKILKGAKPADLPVEMPTKFQLVINLNAAKAIGLEVPPLLLSRADEVIE
jgi:putative tryptophan/tyrosine transport system substrate-binding protein